MNDAISQQDKQNQVAELLKRWRRTNNILLMIVEGGLLLGVMCGATEVVLKYLGLPDGIRYFLMQFTSLSGIMLYMGRHWLKRKRFLLKLSEEEHEILECASRIASKSERKMAVRMLEERKQYQAENETQLLRASSPDQKDGTLLRSATYHDETPREELLRASNTPAE